MRVVFMGTPAFAVCSLQALMEAGHQIVGVFSQPDRPVGRHHNKLQPTPVKECAQSHGIPVFQPEKLRDGAAYINCLSFGESTAPTFQEAMTQLDEQTAVWLVDLRSNPGGTDRAAALSAG